jgi:hypothetical protein
MKKTGILLTLVILVSGCGAKPTTTTGTPEGFIFGETPLEFSWYQNYDYYAAKPWGTDSLAQQWIEDNLKVKVKFMDAGGAAAEKFSIMVVSNDFPDVIQIDRGQDANNLISTGKIVNVDRFTGKYTNYYNDFKNNGILTMLTSDDGKWYQIPNWANAAGNPNGNYGWALNKNIYGSLGRPDIKTYDDLYKYLISVKEKYPNIIPLETAGENIIFGGMNEGLIPDYIVNYYGYPENNKLNLIFEMPEYKESMLLMNKWFNEKLISQDTFSQTKDQLVEKWSNGSVAVLAGEIVSLVARENLLKTGNDWEYIMPVHKAGLDQSKITLQSYNMVGSNVSLITTGAKNPEGIYAFLDWCYSYKGQSLMNYGPQGLYYDDWDADKFPVLKPEYFEKAPSEISKEIGAGGLTIGNTSWVDACALKVYDRAPADKKNWTKGIQRGVIWKTSKNATEFCNAVPSKSSREGIIYQNIADLYKNYKARMIFAKSSAEVEALLAELISKCKAADSDSLLEKETEVWQSNRVKLNMDS